MTQPNSCESCYFWKPSSSKPSHGHCLRFPPTWVSDEADSGWGFPATADRDVCGEYRWAPYERPKNKKRIRIVGHQ